MPLTSISTCYRTLPSYFAEKVTEQMKKRHKSYIVENEKDDNQEIKDLTKSRIRKKQHINSSRNQTLMTKRSCTPLATISDTETEDGSGSNKSSTPNSSNSITRSSTHSTTPTTPDYDWRPISNNQKLFTPRSISKCSRPAFDFKIRPRKTQISPRLAVSLDNVDLWEDDTSDNEDMSYDQINGVAINPRLTIDLSDLRRSRSPIASKRNKLDEEVQSTDGTSSGSPTAQPQPLRTGKRMAANFQSQFTKPEPIVKETLTTIDNKKNLFSLHEKIKTLETPKSAKQTSINSGFKPQAKMSTATAMSEFFKDSESKRHQMIPKSAFQKTNKEPRRLKTHTLNNIDTGQAHDVHMPSVNTSPDRKVKFNDFVTIREGTNNVLSYLKKSHNSSLPLTKQFL